MSSPQATKSKAKKKSMKRSGSMSSPEPISTPRIQFGGKLRKRFYEPLVLQHALGGDPGSRIPRSPLDGQDGAELCDAELRRLFIDMLAYICDFKKNGSTVTAVALERTCSGAVVFWIAANEDVDEMVVPFLKEILADLTFPDLIADDELAAVEEKIFKRAVEFGIQRVKKNWELMQKHMDNCLNALRDDKDLMTWLKSFEDYSDDMLELCRFSYVTRASQNMKKLKKKSSETCNCFSQVRHYIGRLGSHMKAAKTLVAAAECFPALFGDTEIRCCPSPKPALQPPPMSRRTTLEEVVNRMLPANDKRLQYYQDALKVLDSKFGVHKRMTKKYEDPNFLPRVHAELILLELFYIEKYDFVDNDKYIGCSKPACYCCYHYIRAHPGGFVHPASHYKNYLHWRPPDVVDDSEETGKERLKFLNDMIANIRKDVLKQIEEKRGPRNSHRDSTTGITTSVAPE